MTTLDDIRSEVAEWSDWERRRPHPECTTPTLAATRQRITVLRLELLELQLRLLETETDRCPE